LEFPYVTPRAFSAKRISVSEKEVENEIKKIEKNLKTQKSSLEKALAAENITRKDLYERIKLNLTTQKLIEKYTKVTDAEVQDFIDKHPEVFSNNTVAEDVRADIKRRLQEQKITDQTQILINTLKKNANVVIYSK
jgi:transcriptional antiterminator